MARLVSALTEDEVKKTSVGILRTAYNSLSNAYNKLVNNEVIICPVCGKPTAVGGFYKNKNFAIGVFPECKECLMKKATDYDKKTGLYIDNLEKTKEVFKKMDLMFDEPAYNAQLVKINNDVSELGRKTAYSQLMVMVASLPQYQNRHWEHSIFISANDDDICDMREVRPEIYSLFGTGFSREDYLYLQDQYDDWITRVQIDGKSAETYIVRICFKLRDIWVAQKAGRDTSALDKSLNELMAAANLQPKQNVSNASTDTLTFGQLIDVWEEHDPISEPDERYKDVDNLGKYIRIWLMGCLCKVFGFKNKYVDEFEEEMAKYTVTPQEAQEDDNNIREVLFGKSEE